MSAVEVYKLECACGAEIEVPCGTTHRCGKCGRALDIQWRPQYQHSAPQPASEARS